MALFTALKSNGFPITGQRIFSIIRAYSTSVPIERLKPLNYERDPAPHFLKNDNREILKRLARMSSEQVNKWKQVTKNRVEFEFCTPEELEAKFQKARENTFQFMQMVPTVQAESDVIETLTTDPALTNFSDSKYVFTDTSYDTKNGTRMIVVRREDGVLETASPEVRKRMNQTWFPMEGRQIDTPRIFQDKHLQRVLDEGRYVHIMDRAHIQFDPFEKDFHRVSSLVYHHINETKNFNALASTRYFGTMSFYLAWHKIIDNFVSDRLEKEVYTEAVDIIALMYNLSKDRVPYDIYILELIANDERTRTEEREREQTIPEPQSDVINSIGRTESKLALEDTCLNFIEEYIKSNPVAQKSHVNSAFLVAKRKHSARQEVLKSLRKSHGLPANDGF